MHIEWHILSTLCSIALLIMAPLARTPPVRAASGPRAPSAADVLRGPISSSSPFHQPLDYPTEEEGGRLSLSPVGSQDLDSSELVPAPSDLLSRLGMSSFAQLGQAVAIAYGQQPEASPSVPDQSAPPASSGPGSAAATGAAAAQASARLWASGAAAAPLPDLSNGNVEQRAPGITAAAKDFLLGSSSALPHEAVAANALPGGHPFGSGFASLPSVSMAALPTFAGVAMAARGEFGMPRSTTPFLVEQFVMGSSSISAQLPVTTVYDRSIGAPVSRVSEIKFASDAKLLQLFPSFPDFEAAHQMLLASAVRLGYILPSELNPSYTTFMRQLQKALEVLNPLSGGWLAFLKFDRQCRISQFNMGVPWDQAVDMFSFTKVLVQLLPPASGPALKSPRPSPKASGASRPPRGACFSFWTTGACPKGAACPFMAGHHCTRCESTEHGTGQCAAGQGAS